jgi:hypothetical protein
VMGPASNLVFPSFIACFLPNVTTARRSERYLHENCPIVPLIGIPGHARSYASINVLVRKKIFPVVSPPPAGTGDEWRLVMPVLGGSPHPQLLP